MTIFISCGYSEEGRKGREQKVKKWREGRREWGRGGTKSIKLYCTFTVYIYMLTHEVSYS